MGRCGRVQRQHISVEHIAVADVTCGRLGTLARGEYRKPAGTKCRRVSAFAVRSPSEGVHGGGNLRWRRDTRGEMRDLDRVHAVIRRIPKGLTGRIIIEFVRSPAGLTKRSRGRTSRTRLELRSRVDCL